MLKKTVEQEGRLQTKEQLVEHLEGGCKPEAAWRIGTEHEQLAFRVADLRPLPYDDGTPQCIRRLLEGLTQYGWEPVCEKGLPIALQQGAMAITLEPGGQFELSGAPLATLHETNDEVREHARQLRELGREIEVAFLGLGFQPKWLRDEIPHMPKQRYHIMRAYMPTRGQMGLDMMHRTCTVQANLDFGSEADMVKKFRVGLALQPVATALFANSPFTDGVPNGWLSYRGHVWTDTDPDRCGSLPFVHEEGMGFERYVDYMLDVPMYFVYRDGAYVDASGQSFRQFMEGKLPALPGELPSVQDWESHLTVAFPEVRLKRYLELRGADSAACPGRLCALSALWVGLLYDQAALDAAWDLVRDLSAEEHAGLRQQVPRTALQTPLRQGTVRDLSLRVVEIAREGLRRRARTNKFGEDETHFLDSLLCVAESGRTAAQDLLAAYETVWNKNVDPVFAGCML